MNNDLISRSALKESMCMACNKEACEGLGAGSTAECYSIQIIDEQPTVDAVKVVRCKDCIWYHKAHVLCNDGTEKDESEFPDEAFGVLGRKCGVTLDYGINVGGECENRFLFINDEYQFRKPDDYCSRGERKDGEQE
jgi:hypothetical protein